MCWYTKSIMKVKIFITLVVLSLIAGGAYFLFRSNDTQSNNSKPDVGTNTSVAATTPKPTVFNKKTFSTTDPTSIWFVANKHYAMPISYVPADLTVIDVPLRLNKSDMQMQIRVLASNQLTQLFSDAKSTGLLLEFGSGYRSASYQKTLYDGYVTSMGKAEADRSSARAGHSEHQTGLALDFTRTDSKCHLDSCFANLPEGKWLADNAYKYGFILRYPNGKEKTTGYMFEPWHFRFVGEALAKEMHDKNIQTLEEFFGLGDASDYL